ncbi:MAG: hypothetical protein U0556_02840 [Dehalococcoidia bacterium]
MNLTLLRLQPRGPFHFGTDHTGAPAPVIGSDTLFSAVCLALRDLFGPVRLTSFVRVVRSAADPPLRLSNAMPFSGNVLFLPALSGDGWVSQSLFEAQIAGEPLPETRHLQAGWLQACEADDLPVERVWTVDRRRRVRLGAGTPEPFEDSAVRFASGCGLAVLALIDAEWRDDVLAAIRSLGDSGIGGRRSTGAGQFDLAVESLDLRVPDAPTAYCTLSYYLPSARELEQGVLNEPAHYRIDDRTGWTSGPAGSFRHRSVRMITAGSVVAPVDSRPPVGRLADVTPTGFRDHEVLRAGWSFPIGVRGGAA